jgi:hypothetical protein
MFETCEDAHESGLAAAVGADQTDALACTDVEIDVFENGLDTEILLKIMDTKHMNELL